MGVAPDLVSAVLVTRGDVDLAPALEDIAAAGIYDVVVWDNSRELDDEKVFGRYMAVCKAKHRVIYTQDDDCIAPVAELLAAYQGEGLLVNVPAGEKPWLAWGAVFDSTLPFAAFAQYERRYPTWDEDFKNWADVIFATLTPWTAIDLGHEDLEYAFAPNRMYRQPDHYTGQERVEQRCLAFGGTVRRA